MTLAFLFSIIGTVAVAGSLLIVLIEHVRKYDKAEKSQRNTHDVDESVDCSEAGFDWMRAA